MLSITNGCYFCNENQNSGWLVPFMFYVFYTLKCTLYTPRQTFDWYQIWITSNCSDLHANMTYEQKSSVTKELPCTVIYMENITWMTCQKSLALTLNAFSSPEKSNSPSASFQASPVPEWNKTWSSWNKESFVRCQATDLKKLLRASRTGIFSPSFVVMVALK